MEVAFQKTKMKKLIFSIFFIFIFIFSFIPQSFAQSSYVLPYPSVMPGGISYKIYNFWQNALKYWYFGNFGQFTYNLKESDRFLVQAKTLFEYKQYLLGFTALQQSNEYFIKINPYLVAAQNEGKDISQKQIILHEAALKHIEVLESLTTIVPKTFLWQPEKVKATNLNIEEVINQSIKIRQSDL